ncbi:hypothetical protein SEA_REDWATTLEHOG_154 [Gordonia phage RedWattleHog]|uniref:Uncharacterized protein n=1 Tax=Gordonia phage Stormageddon TaxID=2656541 RepID=A0A649VSN4_9CAUD|nr:hypothetical protein KHQ86_gp145 [Gordonia phage Stormageddon]QGJ95015.1 hypothetical protein SEA_STORMAGEDDON_155 [Gordonia phage Stormageddon]QLF83657.1 hypothetical protein SEA_REDWATTLEHOG_154 [Gordonia phage RedWattleHog]
MSDTAWADTPIFDETVEATGIHIGEDLPSYDEVQAVLEAEGD